MLKIKKKWLRRTLWVVTVTILLLVGFIYFFFEGIVISRLESKLYNSYGASYKITYADLKYDLSFTSLSAELEELSIKTDTLKAKEFDCPVINLESKSVSVNNVSLWSFFIYSELNLSSIKIIDPHLGLAKNKNFKVDKKSSSGEQDLNISKHLNSYKFDEFTIENCSFVFYRDLNMTDTLFRLEELDFSAQKFESVNENLSELLVVEKYEKISVISKAFKLNLGKDKYSISVKKLNGDLVAGDLKLKDIHFQPPTSNLRTGKEYRGDVKINQLELIGLDYTLNKDLKLSVDTAIIIDTHVDLTKNQKLSKQTEKVFWMKNILSMKEDLSIDILKFRDCSIKTEIQKLAGNMNYVLELTNLNGRISNFNTKGSKKDLEIELQSNVFESGELDMTVSIPYDKPLVSNFEGRISNINLRSFNDLLMKMFSLKINEGQLQTLVFNGSSYDDLSEGNLTFVYKDLKGSFIKDSNGERKQAFLISKLMNMVINSDNPRAGESEPQRVDFTFTKKKHHGQIMLWLGGVIDGIALTIMGEDVHDFLVNQME